MSDQRITPDPNSPLIRRSQGQIVVARGLWYVKPGQAEFRNERLPPLSLGEVRVTTEYSAISRGTERLVALGQVPKSEWERMRAPLQTGDFPFPVKYGYSAAGVGHRRARQMDRQARLCIASTSRQFPSRRSARVAHSGRSAVEACGIGSQYGNGAQRPLGCRHGSRRPCSYRRSRHYRAVGRPPRRSVLREHM